MRHRPSYGIEDIRRDIGRLLQRFTIIKREHDILVETQIHWKHLSVKTQRQRFDQWWITLTKIDNGFLTR